MIPLETALAIVDDEIGERRVPRETMPVRAAAGRVLACDQRSKLDSPPFDKSVVDGYAVRAGDRREKYRLAGVVAAGEAGMSTLAAGTTVKVMTGAPVPPGTGKVVMVEQAREEDGWVRLEDTATESHICKQAEDVAMGQTILTAGTRLGSLEVANLIGAGIEQVEVARPVRLAVLPTGNEIVNSIGQLGPGKIMNTNGPLLSGLAQRWGLAVTGETVVPDDKAVMRRAITQALGEADIVVLSGGVSAGDFDFVPEVAVECGLEIRFSRVAVRPGLATTFATGDDGILFGLPGNPAAVFAMFHLFVLRAAALLSGGTHEPLRFKVRLASDFSRRSAARTDYRPGWIRSDGSAERTVYHGSAHLAALMQAHGFLVIPEGVPSLPAGAEVDFVVFSARYG